MTIASESSSAPEASPASAPAFRTLHWSLLLVSLSFGILNFLLPIYGQQVGASALEIGLLFSVFSLMSVLLRPLVGFGLDRLGRRWFFIGGLAAYGLTMLGFAHASAVWGLIAARVLQGLAAALLWLAVNAIVADLADPQQRARAFGRVAQSANQGGILGVFIGFSVLLPIGIAAGWRQLFYFYAAAGLAAALLAWRRMPETLPAQVEARPSVLDGLRAVLRSRPLRVLLVVGLITGASSAMLAPIFILYLQEKFQIGIELLAWAFLPAALVWTFLPSRMGRLADRFGRKPLMVIALFAAACVSLLIPRIDSLLLLAGLWVLEAVCFTASDPAGQALITDLTRENQRGRVYGAFALAGGLGAVIGPLAGGWLYDQVGHAAPFILNGAALAGGALALLLWLREPARGRSAAADQAARQD